MPIVPFSILIIVSLFFLHCFNGFFHQIFQIPTQHLSSFLNNLTGSTCCNIAKASSRVIPGFRRPELVSGKCFNTSMMIYLFLKKQFYRYEIIKKCFFSKKINRIIPSSLLKSTYLTSQSLLCAIF